MTEHLQNSALKDHMRNSFRYILTKPEIVKMPALRNLEMYKKQKIYEALMMLKEKASINIQNGDLSNVSKMNY